MTRRSVLLIGATGVFGRRLAQHLSLLDGIQLIVASRGFDKATALARQLNSGGNAVVPMALDTSADIEHQLAALKAWLVIDASGPFQAASFATARAAITAGSHWIDLADARDYILGFGPALDALARANGVCALTGASSTPALSCAVVESLTAGWQRVDDIEIAICPGGRGEVGPSVISAILSYAGRPVAIFDECRAQTATGWGKPVRRHIDGLGARYLSRVETADDKLLQKRFNVTTRIDFRAGLESRLEHFGLMAIAFVRAARGRKGWLADTARLAQWLARARRITALFATDSGAMVVKVSGLDAEGKVAVARWSLLAHHGHGPQVPILPALALTRDLIGRRAEPGARPASEDVKLAAIEAEMAPLSIATSQTKQSKQTAALFERTLGTASFSTLAPALRIFHNDTAVPVWRGRAIIHSPSNFFAWAVRKIIGFPSSAADAPVTVCVERQENSEIWHRQIAAHRFHSTLSLNRHGCVTEQFGPFRFELGLCWHSGELSMPVQRWSIAFVRLPRYLAPKSQTREFQDDAGNFHFDVGIAMPLIGLITRYQGWLRPQPQKL